MELNADFGARVVVHSADEPWRASPMAGVERRMLDRIGGEVARATTIVRFAPGSAFSAHTHGGGEEFIVLDGVFQDEYGDFPAGTYVRNPPTSRHTPRSETGCTIFVKLWQFDPDDRTQFHKDLREGLRGGAMSWAELHRDAFEVVRYGEAAPGAEISLADPGGTELLVIGGTLSEGGENLRQGSWLRLPDGQNLTARAGAQGAKIWTKSGHLIHAKPPAC